MAVSGLFIDSTLPEDEGPPVLCNSSDYGSRKHPRLDLGLIRFYLQPKLVGSLEIGGGTDTQYNVEPLFLSDRLLGVENSFLGISAQRRRHSIGKSMPQGAEWRKNLKRQTLICLLLTQFWR